jgi:hypothetical protein
MMLFERTWCVDSTLDEMEQLRGFVIAGSAAGMFPGVLQRICEAKKPFRLEKVLAREQLLDDPQTDKALRSILTLLVDHWKAEGVADKDTPLEQA